MPELIQNAQFFWNQPLMPPINHPPMPAAPEGFQWNAVGEIEPINWPDEEPEDNDDQPMVKVTYKYRNVSPDGQLLNEIHEDTIIYDNMKDAVIGLYMSNDTQYPTVHEQWNHDIVWITKVEFVN